MGLHFSNPVGLAAGFDKNADFVDALSALGFGFIEIGTVTPKPQAGNPKPRLFRLIQQEALINRMGFNNLGLDHMAQRLRKIKYRGVLGINIGKNKDTPLEQAINDYLLGFRVMAPFASYIAINISSPNTPGLRDLQQVDRLRELLKALKVEQKKQSRYVPLVIKIAPDLSLTEINDMAEIFLEQGLDGLIVSNTTLNRDNLTNSSNTKEAGGLSGAPLLARSTEVIKQFFSLCGDKIPIIASGGIMSADDALLKYQAGAQLVQIYTGLIYRGPKLISDIAKVNCD